MSVGVDVDLSPAGTGRMAIALGILGLLALAVWRTMEPGKFRSLTWVLLGFFAFRVLLGWMRSRKMEDVEAVGDQDRFDE